MRVAIGYDHGGWCLREVMLEAIRGGGHDVIDLGAPSPESSDHPDFALAVASHVARGDADLGVLACGTGIGMAIAANKVRGVYAANVSEPFSARMAREHNSANVLALGGRTVGPELAREIIGTFLASAVDPKERYVRRRSKIKAMELGGR